MQFRKGIAAHQNTFTVQEQTHIKEDFKNTTEMRTEKKIQRRKQMNGILKEALPEHSEREVRFRLVIQVAAFSMSICFNSVHLLGADFLCHRRSGRLMFCLLF